MIPITLVGDLAPVAMDRVAWQTPLSPPGASLTLANLEAPLCRAGLQAAPKAGPHLQGNPAVLVDLVAGLPGLTVTLANNHLMDYGEPGLRQTQAAAAAVGVRTFGAGGNLVEAQAPLIVHESGGTVGLLAATDHWFGLAASDRPGVNPLGPDLPERIRRLRLEVDCVVVSVHGGGEMSPWPSPLWQQTLRALVDAGASIVHAHHPHVPLGWERRGAGWIFYGLGNTVVQPDRWRGPASTRSSWRIQVDAAAPERAPLVSSWTVIPIPGGAELRCTRAAIPHDAEDVVALNAPLADPVLLEGLHQEYAVTLWDSFYADRLNLGDTGARRGRLTARLARDIALAALRPERWRRLVRDRGLFHHHLFSAATHAGEIATALGVLHGEIRDRRTPQTQALAQRWMPRALFET
jgi:poly-gamma-glutamate synthesis protein (capsule biosynthesis protein)